MTLYALDDDGDPVIVEYEEWMQWWGRTDDRALLVARTHVEQAVVSTVFLGIDTRLSADSALPPLVYETIIVNGPVAALEIFDRYPSRALARSGHEAAVATLRQTGEGEL